ncbi:MAG: discoidin domain-containing protein [Magnetococcales bacterium]|nr:discoidin domain-containing protein [Magnetococcales bacterium]
MALHRYWRVYITASTSGSDMLISFYEVEMRGVVGGADQCTGGTASASHNTSTAYRLFDDNPSTYWVNGGPAVASWLQYDWGAGVAVDVAELRLLPRSNLQSPQAFALQYSDNGTDWTAAASWTGVGGWTGGVEKLFVPPPPPPLVVSAQCRQPFALRLASGDAQAYRIGIWVQTACTTPYAVRLAKAGQPFWAIQWEINAALTQGFGVWVAAARGQSCHLLLTVARSQHWTEWLSRMSRQPLWEICRQGSRHPWSLHAVVRVAQQQPMAASWTVECQRPQRFSLLARNPVARRCVSHWNLTTPRSLFPPVPVIQWAGPSPVASGVWREVWRPLSLVAVTIGCLEAEGTVPPPFWSAELQLAELADFVALRLGDFFMLQVGEASFLLQVDGKRLQRAGDGSVVRILAAVSPTARHAAPRAALISQRWTDAQGARSLVEELLGESVVWLLPDWPVPGGRLVATNRSPMQVVQEIAEAAGGLVQTCPDGQLQVCPRFPRPVPAWPTLLPDHCLTDEDILTVQEAQQIQARVDQVWVRNGSVAQGQATLQPDPRPEGPNQGKSRFAPGETVHLLLTPEETDAEVVVTASAGAIMPPVPVQWQNTEDISFMASNQARLT